MTRLSASAEQSPRNITNNLGVMAVDLGPAKLEIAKHTFIHYYDLESIFNHLSYLNRYYNNVSKSIQKEVPVMEHIELLTNNGSKARDIVNYLKLINHTKNTIEDKLDIINWGSKRSKRGLINGLGNAIKFVTGNLDSDDGEKYDKLFEHLKENQNNIMNQLTSQYSFNSEMISEFNQTLKIVNFNFKELENKLQFINDKLSDYGLLEKYRDVLNQLNILYNIVFSLIQDIENSLVFCKLKVLHPSIISTRELYYQIKKISTYYGKQLPLKPELKNMWEFESLIDVNCKLTSKEIVYFLDLPIVDESKFNLFKLISIPNVLDNKYLTIVPKVRYMLKADTSIEGLINECYKKTSSNFICSTEQLYHDKLSCEKEIVDIGTTLNCKYTEVIILNSIVEWTPELNSYLCIFPKEESIRIEKPYETITKSIKGVYLISNNKNDSIYYHNKLLNHVSESKYKTRLLNLDNVLTALEKSQEPDFKINLEQLNFKPIDINKYTPIINKNIVTTSISIWTIIIYVLIIISMFIALFYYRNSKKKQSININIVKPSTPEVLFRDGGVI